MIKFTLTIDGNYLLHSTLSVLQFHSSKNEMFLKSNDEETTRKDVNILLEKLSQVYAKDIRCLGPVIDDVVIAIDDSNSWRKDFYLTKNYKGLTEDIPLKERIHYWFHEQKPNRDVVDSLDNLTDEQKSARMNEYNIPSTRNKDLKYKGNRTKDYDIDWSKIFETFDNFLKGLAVSSNVKFKSIPGCEADDIISVYTSYLNSIGKHVIIYSGDADLKQCVGFNKSTNAFTIQYQKQNKKIWIDRETGLFLKQNKDSYSVDCIRSVVNNTCTKLSVCNPYEVVIDKVLGGDVSDNINSIIVEQKKWATGKKKGQTYDSRVTPTIIEKVKKEIEYEKYNIEDLFRPDFRKKIASSTLRNFKTQNKYNIEDIENNVDVNVNMVLLHKDILPTYLYDEVLNWIESIQDKKKANIKNQMDSKNLLLAMTMYDKKAQDNASSASIFRELGL